MQKNNFEIRNTYSIHMCSRTFPKEKEKMKIILNLLLTYPEYHQTGKEEEAHQTYTAKKEMHLRLQTFSSCLLGK